MDRQTKGKKRKNGQTERWKKDRRWTDGKEKMKGQIKGQAGRWTDGKSE